VTVADTGKVYFLSQLSLETLILPTKKDIQYIFYKCRSAYINSSQICSVVVHFMILSYNFPLGSSVVFFSSSGKMPSFRKSCSLVRSDWQTLLCDVTVAVSGQQSEWRSVWTVSSVRWSCVDLYSSCSWQRYYVTNTYVLYMSVFSDERPDYYRSTARYVAMSTDGEATARLRPTLLLLQTLLQLPATCFTVTTLPCTQFPTCDRIRKYS